jgi:hypothetical protein
MDGRIRIIAVALDDVVDVLHPLDRTGLAVVAHHATVSRLSLEFEQAIRCIAMRLEESMVTDNRHGSELPLAMRRCWSNASRTLAWSGLPGQGVSHPHRQFA